MRTYIHTYIHTYMHAYIHHITSHHITSNHIASNHTTSHHITLHNTTLDYSTLHYITYMQACIHTLHSSYRYIHNTCMHAGIHTYIHTCIHAYIILHYITLHYTTLHYTTLHVIALHCFTLHYIALHTFTSWPSRDTLNAALAKTSSFSKRQTLHLSKTSLDVPQRLESDPFRDMIAKLRLSQFGAKSRHIEPGVWAASGPPPSPRRTGRWIYAVDFRCAWLMNIQPQHVARDACLHTARQVKKAWSALTTCAWEAAMSASSRVTRDSAFATVLR